MSIEIICKMCRFPIPFDRDDDRIYCSQSCKDSDDKPKQKKKLGRYDKRVEPAMHNPVHIGTVGELAVCVDLLRRGYDVYRSVSPSGKCDLVAVMDDKCTRVEVKAGVLTRNGDTTTHAIISARKNRYDVLAVYMRDRIVYIPEL